MSPTPTAPEAAAEYRIQDTPTFIASPGEATQDYRASGGITARQSPDPRLPLWRRKTGDKHMFPVGQWDEFRRDVETWSSEEMTRVKRAGVVCPDCYTHVEPAFKVRLVEGNEAFPVALEFAAHQRGFHTESRFSYIGLRGLDFPYEITDDLIAAFNSQLLAPVRGAD